MTIAWIALLIFYCSAAYLALACVVVLRFHARVAGFAPTGELPPVTLLKPLCGSDPELSENLHACCRQVYPTFQVVFGVLDPADEAAEVARRVIAAYPEADLQVLAGGPAIGRNRKVANLANMAPHIRHDLVVIADSDMRVGTDYLQRVVAPFEIRVWVP